MHLGSFTLPIALSFQGFEDWAVVWLPIIFMFLIVGPSPDGRTAPHHRVRRLSDCPGGRLVPKRPTLGDHGGGALARRAVLPFPAGSATPSVSP